MAQKKQDPVSRSRKQNRVVGVPLTESRYPECNGSSRALSFADEARIRSVMESSNPEDNCIHSRLWDFASVRLLGEKFCGKSLSDRTIANYVRRFGYPNHGCIMASLHGGSKQKFEKWWELVRRNAAWLTRGGVVLWYHEARLCPDENPCAPDDSLRGERWIMSVATPRGSVRWLISRLAPTAKQRIDFLARVIDEFEGKRVFLIHGDTMVYSGRGTQKWLQSRTEVLQLWRSMDSSLARGLCMRRGGLLALNRLARDLKSLPVSDRKWVLAQLRLRGAKV